MSEAVLKQDLEEYYFNDLPKKSTSVSWKDKFCRLCRQSFKTIRESADLCPHCYIKQG